MYVYKDPREYLQRCGYSNYDIATQFVIKSERKSNEVMRNPFRVIIYSTNPNFVRRRRSPFTSAIFVGILTNARVENPEYAIYRYALIAINAPNFAHTNINNIPKLAKTNILVGEASDKNMQIFPIINGLRVTAYRMDGRMHFATRTSPEATRHRYLATSDKNNLSLYEIVQACMSKSQYQALFNLICESTTTFCVNIILTHHDLQFGQKTSKCVVERIWNIDTMTLHEVPDALRDIVRKPIDFSQKHQTFQHGYEIMFDIFATPIPNMQFCAYAAHTEKYRTERRNMSTLNKTNIESRANLCILRAYMDVFQKKKFLETYPDVAPGYLKLDNIFDQITNTLTSTATPYVAQSQTCSENAMITDLIAYYRAELTRCANIGDDSKHLASVVRDFITLPRHAKTVVKIFNDHCYRLA